MTKAVIFDFDGLILDTETAWFDAYKHVLQKEFQFELLLDDFSKSVGSDISILFSFLEKKLGKELDQPYINEQASTIHTETIKDLDAREGVKEFLDTAKELNLKIALCSSSHYAWVHKHLNHLNLYDYFDYFITQDDVSKIKPDPELYLKTLDTLDIKPSEAIVFEDSLNGLLSAQQANIPVVLVPNPVTKHIPFENYFLKLNSMKDKNLTDIINMVSQTTQK